MRRILRHRPSPVMVVAFIALSVALAGTATALPGRNAVKKGDIARSAVTSRNIARSAVRSNHIKSRKRHEVEDRPASDRLLARRLERPDRRQHPGVEPRDRAQRDQRRQRCQGQRSRRSEVLLQSAGDHGFGFCSGVGGPDAQRRLQQRHELECQRDDDGEWRDHPLGWNVEHRRSRQEQDFYVENNDFNVGNTFDPLDNATTGSTSLEGSLVYVRQDGGIVTASFSGAGEQRHCTFAGTVTG